MNFIIISKEFGEKEKQLLSLNLGRIESILNDFRIVYCINGIGTPRIDFDRRVAFVATTVSPSRSACAATNRLAGWQYLLTTPCGRSGDKIIVFMDGDMVIGRSYLRYLQSFDREMIFRPSIICSDRIDLRCSEASDRILAKRSVRPIVRGDGSFKSIYGAFAIRNIDPSLMIATHDHEEQWFLTMCKVSYGRRLLCEKYEGIGIIHLDKWYGGKRLTRVLRSPRGVGFWQGMLAFRYGFRGLLQMLSDHGYLLFLLVLTVAIGLVSPLLALVPFLIPRVAKRLIWLILGLAKLPFFRIAKNVEYKKI